MLLKTVYARPSALFLASKGDEVSSFERMKNRWATCASLARGIAIRWVARIHPWIKPH